MEFDRGIGGGAFDIRVFGARVFHVVSLVSLKGHSR